MAKYKNKQALKWRFKRLIKNLFLLDILAFFYFTADKLTTVNNNRIIYFLAKGEKFNDNIRFFYEYMIKNSDYENVILVNDTELYKTLIIENQSGIFKSRSIKGFLLFLKTKTIVIANGLDKMSFFPYYLSPRTKNIIQLWHGSLFKRLGFQVKNWQDIKKRKEYQRFSKFVVCSTLEKFMAASCFNMCIDDIWITDYPRNDYLLNPTKDLTKKHNYLKNKTILYAPTWREEGNKVIFFPFEDKNLSEIQEFLEQNNAYLLIRGHSEELERIYNQYDLSIEMTNRILPANQKIFPETAELLPYIDILITDYSGIYHDFLLLKRPIIFIPYDLEQYSEYRGIMLNYNNYTAGYKVYTQNQLIRKIGNLFENPNLCGDERIKMMETFHDFYNGKACERIKNKIEILLEKKTNN